MSVIFDNTLKLFAKHSKKLPHVMMIIYIYCVAFPGKALELKNILISKIQIILPETFAELLTKLHFIQNDVLTIWTFLLILYAATVVIDIIHQILELHTLKTIGSEKPVLLKINSIFFLSILIFNSLCQPGIRFSSLNLNGVYFILFIIAVFLFAFIFLIAYCSDFILIYRKINEYGISMKPRMISNIIYWCFTVWILSKIYYTLF